MMIAIIIILSLLSLLLIWEFAAYPLLMTTIARRSKPKQKDYSFKPFISIIVPAYNESRSIRQRLTNLVGLDYPKDKYEIVVVESGSKDNTFDIASDAIKELEGQSNMPSVRLLKETERKGKASAINFGASNANGEIVLVTDANAVFDKDVLKEIAPNFSDPKVGGCGGRYIVPNIDNDLASSESFYWDVECLMRQGESALDSSCTFHGEINAWRKSLVKADIKMVTEDLDMAVQIRRSGHRVRYESKAIVYEPSATTVKDQITQRKRTALGTIQCLFKHWRYFFFPRDLYSLVIFPSHKTLGMFSPFLLLALPIMYLLLYAVGWEPLVPVIHLPVTLGVFILALLGLQIAKKGALESRVQNRKAENKLVSFVKLVYYVLLNEYLIVLAWKDYAIGKRSVLWQKVESTR